MGAAMLTSCGDEWLNQEPSTSIQTETAIQNLQDCYASLNGIYSTMQNAYAYSGRLVYYADAAGDDMQAYSETKRTGDAYLHNYTKNTVKTSYWEYPYSMIGACNNIICNIDNIVADDTALRDNYKGQALALRGMFLFDLTRLFGYPYKKDDVTTFHEGRVVGVNVDNAENRKNNRSRALLIEDGTLWIIGNEGKRQKN